MFNLILLTCYKKFEIQKILILHVLTKRNFSESKKLKKNEIDDLTKIYLSKQL